LPRWLTEWPSAGGALSLTPAEAAYLESFTGTTMLLGFIVLVSASLRRAPRIDAPVGGEQAQPVRAGELVVGDNAVH
jgi:hypothetical protein